MIHAVIIDDEMNGVRSLELLLSKFVPDVKVVATTTDAEKGVGIINDYRPDLVFLDINMPALNGFELLEKLEFKSFHLVFSTAYQEFALKALKLSASDYLLKPIDHEELIDAVRRVKLKMNDGSGVTDVIATFRELAEIKSLRVPLPTKDAINFISPDDIIYIEANSNNSIVMMSNGTKENVNNSLKDYELLLCKNGFQFMRVHNSFIINLHHVTRYLKEDGGYVVMQGKKTIPVSKHKKDEFLKFINLKEN